MNLVHLHLVLNHIPVVASAFGLFLLLVSAWRRDSGILKAALLIFVLSALLAVPLYLTGEPAEGVAQSYGASKVLIERHEDAAGFALAMMEATGALALLGLLRNWHKSPKWFVVSLAAAAVITASLVAWTAMLGGQIRHPEIGTSSASVSNPVQQPVTGSKHDD